MPLFGKRFLLVSIMGCSLLLLVSRSVTLVSSNVGYLGRGNENYFTIQKLVPTSPKNCTASDLKSINSIISNEVRKSETTCPETTWLSSFYSAKHKASMNAIPGSLAKRKFLGINIGCNKGYDAVDTMRMGAANPDFDVRKWTATINQTLGRILHGACNQEFMDPFVIPEGVPAVENAVMHCVEPLFANIDLIDTIASKMGLKRKGLVMSQAAISRSSGKIRFPKGQIGRENLGIRNCADKSDDDPSCELVDMLSLDDFYSQHVPENQLVDVLLIDTEGNDYEVLMGAQKVLRRTRYLEFEYHHFLPWKNTPLIDAINYLASLDFTCYWALKKRLLRITNCWQDIYKHHSWSNIACVKSTEVELAAWMENIFKNEFLP